MKTLFIKLLTVVGFSSFKASGAWYRVTDYYYIYTFANGERILIPCPKIFANGIGGYGICGWYIPFSKVEALSFKFKHRWIFFKRRLFNKYAYSELKTLWFYRFEKQGLSDKYFLRKAVNHTMKRFDKKCKIKR